MALKIEEEIWKDIIGYEGLYMISNLGRVKSLVFRNNKYEFKREKILKPAIITLGYYYVTLSKNSKVKIFLIHRLIALHFIDNPNNFDCVDHINRDRKDNSIENLRWCNHSTNSQNKTKKKNTSSQYIGVNWSKRAKKWYARIRINGKNKFLGQYDDEEEAARTYDEFALEHYGKDARTNFTYD